MPLVLCPAVMMAHSGRAQNLLLVQVQNQNFVRLALHACRFHRLERERLDHSRSQIKLRVCCGCRILLPLSTLFPV